MDFYCDWLDPKRISYHSFFLFFFSIQMPLGMATELQPVLRPIWETTARLTLHLIVNALGWGVHVDMTTWGNQEFAPGAGRLSRNESFTCDWAVHFSELSSKTFLYMLYVIVTVSISITDTMYSPKSTILPKNGPVKIIHSGKRKCIWKHRLQRATILRRLH